jgi:hypothetical protein
VDHARLDHLEALEEPADVVAAAERRRVGGVHGAVEPLLDHPHQVGLEVVGHVGEGQVAAGGEGVEQPAHDPVGVVLVGDDVEQADHDQRHRPGQVEDLGRHLDDGVGQPDVALDERGAALDGAHQEGVGVGEHDRVVVDVHDPGFGVDALGHGVDVVAGGDAGADVEELADADLARQVPHAAAEEGPVGPGVAAGAVDAAGVGGEGVLGDLAVDREVVAAPEEVVVDPGRVGDGAVDRHGGTVGAGRHERALCHDVPPSGVARRRGDGAQVGAPPREGRCGGPYDSCRRPALFHVPGRLRAKKDRLLPLHQMSARVRRRGHGDV